MPKKDTIKEVKKLAFNERGVGTPQGRSCFRLAFLQLEDQSAAF